MIFMGNFEKLFLIALFLNVSAVIIGGYYYIDQLASTQWHLLVFVPDCPFYVLLALLIILGVVRNEIFSFMVSVGMVKYGLWTVFAILFHWGVYSQPPYILTSFVFIIGHLGMAAEGLALLPKKPARLALALALAWFLLNDVSDYFWGTVPSLPPGGLSTVRNLTFASSIALPFMLFLFAPALLRLAPIKFLRRVCNSGSLRAIQNHF
jgi:uncharacterized membrane protein YpjA